MNRIFAVFALILAEKRAYSNRKSDVVSPKKTTVLASLTQRSY